MLHMLNTYRGRGDTSSSHQKHVPDRHYSPELLTCSGPLPNRRLWVEPPIMQFSYILPLIVALASSSVVAIHPHLSARTVAPECDNKCNATYTKYQQHLSGICDLLCICVPSTIDDASACYTCLEADGVDPTPLSPDVIRQTIQGCVAAGYPIAGVSTVSGAFGSATNFPLSGCTTLPSITGFPPFSIPSKAVVKNTGVAIASGRLGILIAVVTTCLVDLTV